MITDHELGELNSILERLETLNAKLRSELDASRKSLLALGNELEACRTDLVALQESLARSQAESTALGEQSRIVANSLQQAEKSFGEFKSAVQSRIRQLTVQRNIAVVLAVILAFV